MSTQKITLKHNKHLIHPCPNDKKLELLTKLINDNEKKSIFVISSQKLSLTCSDDIKIMDDKELFKLDDTCEVLISYDLPNPAIIYMSRISKATESAIILLDTNEQTQLYPIETLLGRVIRQENIEGFECEAADKITLAQPAPVKEYKFKADEERKEKEEQRKIKEREERSSDKAKQWEKKDRKPNKFLGKDDNGKAIFSGKSGDRNHKYDGTPREKWEKPKKVGRKINIKARKPKED